MIMTDADDVVDDATGLRDEARTTTTDAENADEIAEKLASVGLLRDDVIEPAIYYEFRKTPTVYACGHGTYNIRRKGKPGVVATLTANSPEEAQEFVDLLNAARRDLGCENQ